MPPIITNGFTRAVLMCDPGQRIQIILDPKLIYWHRRPRSKKLRILIKWGRKKRNWRPDHRLWEQRLIMGSMAHHRMVNQEKPVSYRLTFAVHPETWEAIRQQEPAFAALCDVCDTLWNPIAPLPPSS